MYLSKYGYFGEFQFSKVKLSPEKGNLTDYDEKIVPSKVKDIAAPTISKTSIPDLDLLTLTNPFICLFLVAITICLLNILKTSFLSSTRTEQTQRKFQQVCSPNINILEPSSVVAAHDDDVHGDSDSGFIYLAPA